MYVILNNFSLPRAQSQSAVRAQPEVVTPYSLSTLPKESKPPSLRWGIFAASNMLVPLFSDKADTTTEGWSWGVSDGWNPRKCKIFYLMSGSSTVPHAKTSFGFWMSFKDTQYTTWIKIAKLWIRLCNVLCSFTGQLQSRPWEQTCISIWKESVSIPLRVLMYIFDIALFAHKGRDK